MAKEAFSASILESNLESLKNKTSEVSQQFKELSSSAESFGIKFSQSVRAATGNIQGLKSALNSLEGSIKRTTGTSSAIGAANISSSLGALTGQGRGGYRGVGGGGGGGGGALGAGMLSGGLGSAVVGGIGGTLGRGMQAAGMAIPGIGGAVLGGLGGVLGYAAQKAGKVVDFGQGMMMGAARQSYGLQGSMERMHRTAGYRQGGLGGKGMAARYNWSDIGYAPEEAFGVIEMMSQAGGARDAGGRGVSRRGKAFAQRAQWLGMDPMSLSGSLATARAAGYGRGGSFDKLATGAVGRAMGGRYGGRKTRGFNQERVHRGRFMAEGVTNLLGQQAAVAPAQPQEMSRMFGLMGMLSGEGGFEPAIANQVGGALARGTFAPGGGEGGALFGMRAGGFGNPNIRGYKKTALEMGIDPNIIKRRSFTEYKEWKEKSTVDRIQSSLVGMQFENRGRPGMQALQLEAMYGKEGMSFTQAQKLVRLGQEGKLGDKSLIQEEVDKFKTKGAVTPEVTGQMAKYNRALLKMRKSVISFGKAVNTFQVKNLDAIGKGLEKMEEDLIKLNTELKDFNALSKPYIKIGELNVKGIRALTKLVDTLNSD